MKGKCFTEEQIAFALRQVESSVSLIEICRKVEVSMEKQKLYRSTSPCISNSSRSGRSAGMGVFSNTATSLRKAKTGLALAPVADKFHLSYYSPYQI